MKISGSPSYVAFFITIYISAFIASLVFDSLMFRAPRVPGQHLPNMPFSLVLIFGCMIHLLLASQSSHPFVRKLAEESTKVKLVSVGVCSGLLEIAVCFMMFSLVGIGFSMIRRPAPLTVAIAVVLALGATTVPAGFVPLMVTHFFARNIDKKS